MEAIVVCAAVYGAMEELCCIWATGGYLHIGLAGRDTSLMLVVHRKEGTEVVARMAAFRQCSC